jgi:threonine aldolase
MPFGSDNWAGAHPAVMDALAAANDGLAPAYGNDPLTQRAIEAVQGAFETDCAVLFVATGTAANGLALSALTPPYGAVICQEAAHVAVDEGNAIGLFGGGARLLPLAGDADGKLTPADLEAAARAHSPANVHGLQPRVVSLTNLTESGTLYRPEEIAALAAVCRAEGWALHLDGARLANALAATGASPADMTWRAGVDALSLGLTKTGALCAEAVVLFGEAGRTALPYLRKRAGHLFSKHRVLAAQVCALMDGGLWLRLAAHSNAIAAQLARALEADGAVLAFPGQANEVFARLSPAQAGKLASAGIGFYAWPDPRGDVYRFVASWASTPDDVARVSAALRAPGGAARPPQRG